MNKRKQLSLFLLCLLLLFQSVGIYCTPASSLTVKAIQPQVSIGDGFMVALTTQGKLYAWGKNAEGTLGNESTTSTTYATPVSAPSNAVFTSVSAGNDHVLALAADGSVYTWGANNNGQLGYENIAYQTKPKIVEALPHDDNLYAVAIAAGNAFSLVLMNNGTVWGWGLNDKCQLGTTGASISTPEQISILDSQSNHVFITEIYAGASVAAAITVSGSVYFWGDNMVGQLGVVDSLSEEVFLHQSLSACDAIAFGHEHTVALLNNSTVKHAGKNDKAQFGHSTSSESYAKFLAAEFLSPTEITSVSAGAHFTIALTKDGEVFIWGYDPNGAIGTDNANQINTPTKVDLHDAVIAGLCAYKSNVAVITNEGFVYTWGSNTSGQLGNHTKTASTTPVAVCLGTNHTDLLNLGQGPAVITQNAFISVQANIPAPTYTVTIPSTIPVGMLEQTTQKQDQSHISQKDFSVEISNVGNLFDEKKIVVTLSSRDSTGNFVLRDVNNETYLLAYTVMTDFGLPHEIHSGDIYAEFTENGSVTGRILVDRSQITRDGAYTGTVTFAVSVVDIAEQS